MGIAGFFNRLKSLGFFQHEIKDLKVIADAQLPLAALEKLSQFAEIIPFSTQKIVYPAISGHPDIFFSQTDENLLITAPNLPEKYYQILQESAISYIKGKTPLGMKYPETALYCALSGKDFIIHNFKITDEVLKNQSLDKKKYSIHQGYTRCSLFHFSNRALILSDRKALKILSENFDTFYISPDSIILPGMPHGFIGGALGSFEDKVFLTGSLQFLKEGQELKRWIHKKGFELIELYQGPIFDGGSLLFIRKN